MPEHLFVYGTLRKGSGPVAALLDASGARLGAATATGRLLDLGSFPGLVDGDGAVVGEVVALEEPGVLDLLDEYEGSLFRRERRAVRLADGAAIEAWAYVYAGPAGEVPEVPGGDWAAVGTR